MASLAKEIEITSPININLSTPKIKLSANKENQENIEEISIPRKNFESDLRMKKSDNWTEKTPSPASRKMAATPPLSELINNDNLSVPKPQTRPRGSSDVSAMNSPIDRVVAPMSRGNSNVGGVFETPLQQIIKTGALDADSVSSIRDTLGRLSVSSKKGASTRTNRHGKKYDTFNHKVDLFAQLEKAYALLEERERDVQLAAEIGQMLLQKNEALIEESAENQRILEGKIRQYDGEIQQAYESLQNAESETMRANSLREQTLAELEEVQEELFTERKNLRKALNDKERAETEIKSLQSLRSIVETDQADMENDRKTIQKLRAELSHLKNVSSENQDLYKRVEEMEELLEKEKQISSSTKRERNATRTQLQKLERRLTQSESRRDQEEGDLEAALSSSEQLVRSLKKDYAKLKTELKKVEMEAHNKAEKETDISDLKAELSYSKRMIEDLTRQEQEDRDLLEEARSELVKTRNELDELKTSASTKAIVKSPGPKGTSLFGEILESELRSGPSRNSPKLVTSMSNDPFDSRLKRRIESPRLSMSGRGRAESFGGKMHTPTPGSNNVVLPSTSAINEMNREAIKKKREEIMAILNLLKKELNLEVEGSSNIVQKLQVGILEYKKNLQDEHQKNITALSSEKDILRNMVGKSSSSKELERVRAALKEERAQRDLLETKLRQANKPLESQESIDKVKDIQKHLKDLTGIESSLKAAQEEQNQSTFSSELIMLRSQITAIEKARNLTMHKIQDLISSLQHTSLRYINRTNRGKISGPRDLLKLSNIAIDSLIKTINDNPNYLDYQGWEPELTKITRDLVIENARLRKILNDYTEGLQLPVLNKLEAFMKDFKESSIVNGPLATPSSSLETPSRGLRSLFYRQVTPKTPASGYSKAPVPVPPPRNRN